MKNAYEDLRNRQEKEFNDFPLMFAFSDKQFKEGMEAWGLKETDTDKILSIGAGGFVRKSDGEAMHEMTARHSAQMKEAIESDTTGEDFIKQMFLYELANHEFSYTGDLEPAFTALGLTAEEVSKSPALKHGLQLAIDETRE